MAQKTLAQAAANWGTAMAAPSTAANYKAGIQNTSVNPMAMAASPDAQQKYLAKTSLAVSSGKMANALNNTPVSTWKNNAMNIGAQNLASGAKKGGSKYVQNLQPYANVWPQMKAASQAIPGGTIAAAAAKSAAALQVLMGAAGYTS